MTPGMLPITLGSHTSRKPFKTNHFGIHVSRPCKGLQFDDLRPSKAMIVLCWLAFMGDKKTNKKRAEKSQDDKPPDRRQEDVYVC